MNYPDRHLRLALFSVFVLALAIRSTTLFESLWLDELHTSWAVSGPLSEVAGRAADGNQSPLFFYAVWGATTLLGHHEWSLRLVSLVAGTLAVVGLMLMIDRWTHSRWLTLLVGVLATCDCHYIFFARDARPYAVVQLLTVIHLGATDWQYRRLIADDRPSAAVTWLWLAVTWLLFYTHYTSMLLLPAELLAGWLAASPTARRRLCRTWLRQLAVLAIGCSLALPHLALVFSRRDNWRAFVDVQPFRNVFTILPADLYLGGPLAALVVCWAIRGSARPADRTTNTPNRPAQFAGSCRLDLWRTTLLSMTFFVPAVIAWLATYRNDHFAGIAPLFFRRYLIAASIPLVALSGWMGVALIAERRRAVFCCMVVLVTAWQATRWPRTQWTVHSREDWPAALRAIDEDGSAFTWPIVLRAGVIEDEQLGPTASERLRAYCEFPLRALYKTQGAERQIAVLPSRRPFSWDDLSLQARAGLSVAPGVWVLSRGSESKAESFVGRLDRLLTASGKSIEARDDYRVAGLSVIRLKFALPTEKLFGTNRPHNP